MKKITKKELNLIKGVLLNDTISYTVNFNKIDNSVYIYETKNPKNGLSLEKIDEEKWVFSWYLDKSELSFGELLDYLKDFVDYDESYFKQLKKEAERALTEGKEKIKERVEKLDDYDLRCELYYPDLYLSEKILSDYNIDENEGIYDEIKTQLKEFYKSLLEEKINQ